jgi:hypothetical protein
MSLNLRAGELVEIRSKEEILATLDAQAQLDGLPFMPEMFAYCGKRLRVFKRAHKTCDPPNGMQGRRMERAVHLEDIRCDGAAHGGCQAGCLIFWKEAWLRRVSPGTQSHAATLAVPGACDEQNVWARTTKLVSDPSKLETPTYVCQNTNIAAASHPLRWWDFRQYVEDLRSGNVRIGQMAAAFLFFLYHHLATAGLGIGSALRLLYDVFQKVRGGTPYPWRMGRIPKGSRTPSAKLDLMPGDVVRTKSYREILETLDEDWRNRGMYFDAESVPFCEQTHRVLARVEKIIDEKTGKMIKLKNDAIILDGVACEAKYAKCRRFCPRSIYPYWREIWLEREAQAEKKMND